MAPKIRVRERDRDEEFGIIRKRIEAPRLPSFETPTKCLKGLSRKQFPSNVSVNEVIRRIYPETVELIQKGPYPSPRKTIMSRFLPNRLNLTIFELMFNSVPSSDKIETIAHYLYAGSQSTFVLPTVKTAMLKEGNKFSTEKINEYVEMMRNMIEVTEATGNTKAFIGTIPLIPSKFSGRIVELCLSKGVTAFAIDVGTKDFLNHETDFRSILSKINKEVHLDSAFIYACNLGIPRFVQDRARADDFLSLFAYVDAFGSTFKTRGHRDMPKGVGRAKQFVKEHLYYEISTYKEFYERRGMPLWKARRYLNDVNQREQLTEADMVRKRIGEERMQEYLNAKSGIDSIAMKRLGSIAEKVKIG